VNTNCWINSYVARLIALWPAVTSLTLLNHAHHGFKFAELRDAINGLKSLERLSTDMSIEQLTELTSVGQLRELTAECFYAKELPQFLPQLDWSSFKKLGLKI